MIVAITIPALWLPILLSAVGVFVASSLLHMVLGFHRKDYRGLPDEGGFREALTEVDMPPGSYFVPFADDPKEMGSEEMMAKYDRGPVLMMTVFPNAAPNMGRLLGLWFAYSVLVGILVAYVATFTVDPAASGEAVFRLVSTVAFLAYSTAHLSDSIWKGQPWGTTLRHVFGGLVYGLLTGGVFAWLWP